MSKPSNWPLAEDSTRQVAPVVIREQLAKHPLSQDCYPLAVGHYENAQGHQMQRKRHDDNIVIHCLDGSGWLHTPHWEGDINAGEVALIPSGVPHRYAANTDNPWTIDWCHFSGSQAKAFLDNMDYLDNKPVRKLGQNPQLKGQFTALLANASAGYNLKVMIHAANMLKQLLTHVGALLIENANNRQKSLNVDSIQSHMLQNLDKLLTLEELAALANLSKFHFSKKDQQLTGHAPIQHFIAMKVEYAKYLLETSNLGIQEIALRLGYEDNLYFSRFFKKHEGIAPSLYRKSAFITQSRS